MKKSIAIDEEGYFLSNQNRIDDRSFGLSLLENLSKSEFGSISTFSSGEEVIVEAFNQPLMAVQIEKTESFDWIATAPYGFKFSFDVRNLRVDDWDRFHGENDKGIPFVMSRSGQSEFFNLVDEFEDDAVIIGGERIPIPDLFFSEVNSNPSDYWSKIYEENERPGWEMEEPNPALVASLSQLKLQKCRILVPGCGSANDAAYLAEQGHIVTAIDFSQEAVDRAKKKYGHIENLKIEQADFFEWAQQNPSSIDLIFEHTFFCAIPPERRDECIKAYNYLLTDLGYVLGVFFIMDRKHHPPWGSSEWEIRERMKKRFDFLYWTRWKNESQYEIDSQAFRNGIELVVCARKKEQA